MNEYNLIYPMLSMAWMYVLTRALHARIHIGGNRMGKRIQVYEDENMSTARNPAAPAACAL